MTTSNKIKIGFLGAILVAVCYFIFFYKSDLRTDIVKNNPQPVEGRALLMKMAAAHRIHLWDSVSTYTVAFQDEFFGKIGALSHPYPKNQIEIILDYIPNTFNGRISFEDGSAWGVQTWKSYIRQPGGQAVFKSDKDILFWIPTYQYFIELPLRIQKATEVSYAGEKEISGKLCKGIFATWNKYQPQSNVDQYLIWIDTQTNLIHQVEFTIREQAKFISGTINFLEYKEFNGMPLATNMPVDAPVGDGILHRMRINGISFDMIPKDDLLPNKDLPLLVDSKEFKKE